MKRVFKAVTVLCLAVCCAAMLAACSIQNITCYNLVDAEHLTDAGRMQLFSTQTGLTDTYPDSTALKEFDAEFFEKNDLVAVHVLAVGEGKTVEVKSQKIDKNATITVVLKTVTDKSPFANVTETKTISVFIPVKKDSVKYMKHEVTA